MLKATLVIEFLEQAAKIAVIGCLFEFEVATVAHVRCHFLWVAKTELLNGRINFGLFYLLVLLLFITGLEALPWQLPLQHVQ
jgi:hypothetical protein